MDLEHAREILAALADGIDPISGEVLPPEDSCNTPEVIRALHTVLGETRITRIIKKEGSIERPFFENAGKPWTQEDDETLCTMFDEGSTRAEMSRYMKRTSGAIAARLVRLGKITFRAQLK